MRRAVPGLILTLTWLVCWLAASGCRLRESVPVARGDASYYEAKMRKIEYPDVKTEDTPGTRDTPKPLVLSDQLSPEITPLSLEQAIQMALANSPVLRDLGGMVLQAPQTLSTTMMPAMAEMDPRFGVEAALSAFDAMVAAGAYFEKNDRLFNNSVQGFGTQEFQQDLNNYSFELRKKTAAGTTLNLREKISYDFNNSPFNYNTNSPIDPALPSNLPWTMLKEGEFRQPLFQGAGAEFNRIAGPNSTPGYYNGVLIARVNTDISLADFEAGVTQLVSNVKNAYWELYLAFRTLDAKIAARTGRTRLGTKSRYWPNDSIYAFSNCLYVILHGVGKSNYKTRLQDLSSMWTDN